MRYSTTTAMISGSWRSSVGIIVYQHSADIDGQEVLYACQIHRDQMIWVRDCTSTMQLAS